MRIDVASVEWHVLGVELNRQRKVGLAVAAVAIAALVVDRMTGGGPSPLGPSSAQAAAEPVGAAPEKPAKSATAAGALDPAPTSVRARLDAVRAKAGSEVSDVFAPPKAWVAEAAAPVRTGTEPTTEEKAAALAAAHRLTGVSMGSKQVVVIDGNPYTLGATRNGLTLVSIAADGRSVTIESGGVEATLTLSSTDR